MTDEEEVTEEEWNDEDLAENRWYKEPESPRDENQEKAEGIPEITVTDKEMLEWSLQWGETLIINVLGKKVNYRALENKLNREWARTGPIKIIDMPRGFYAVKFDKTDDYNHALLNGPWMIADHYILVQRWRRNFLKSARTEQKVAVWVRVPELPLESYNDTFLKRLGARLGSMLKIDRLTSIHSRGQFARICVEIDLAKSIVPQVMVRGETLNVEYEGLHTICFHCGVYGHRESQCLRKIEAEQVAGVKGKGGEVSFQEGQTMAVAMGKGDGGGAIPEPMPMEEGASSHARVNEVIALEKACEEEEDRPRFGPWMVVHKSKGKKKTAGAGKEKVDMTGVGRQARTHVNRSAKEGTGSRFKSLEAVESEAKGPTNSEVEPEANRGELFIYKDQVNGFKGVQGPGITKVRNPAGGKNTQLGPRVRDAKKAARSMGPPKKNQGFIKGPKIQAFLFKENIQPLLNQGVSGPSLARIQMEKVKVVADNNPLMGFPHKVPTGKILQNADPAMDTTEGAKSQMENGKAIDKGTQEDKNGDFETSSPKGEDAAMQTGNQLSEQTIQKGAL